MLLGLHGKDLDKQFAEIFLRKELDSMLKEGSMCDIAVHPEGFLLRNKDVTIEIGYQNAEVTSCKISYWDEPLFDVDEALTMLKNGEFAQLRNSVFGILSLLPINVTQNDRNICKDALHVMEQVLVREACDSTFTAINTAKYGFFCPRTPLRPGRLYYVAEPMYFRSPGRAERTHANDKDLDILPYIEISFIHNDTPCPMPISEKNGEWQEFVEARACVRLKFSGTILISHTVLRRLEKLIAKSPLVRHYTNTYRYMSGKDKSSEGLTMMTKFPKEIVQHVYEIEPESLTTENDPVIVEMYIKDLKDLEKVITLLRSEWMHNSFYESMLAACVGNEKVSSTEEPFYMRTFLSRKCFEFTFQSVIGVVTVEIGEVSDGKWKVETRNPMNGALLAGELDERMTDTIMKQDDASMRGGVLLFLAEVDENVKNAVANAAAERAKRIEKKNVYSDLEKMRKMTELEESSRTQMHHHQLMNPLMRQNHMSTLETARMQMKQSMSAATAVALASQTPTTPSMFASPMGHPMNTARDNFFDFSDVGSPAGSMSPSPFSQTSRGGKTPQPRKPRARKTGETVGMSPNEANPAPGRGRGRKPRGAATAGSRKASDFMIEPSRPNFQRSFSELAASPGSTTPRTFESPLAQVINNYNDEDSDDECDPPPPPKLMPPLKMSMPPQASPKSLQSPNNHQTITPSPLSVPQRQNSWNTPPDIKPDVSLLNKMLRDSPATVDNKRKSIDLEATISKIKNQQQQQQHTYLHHHQQHNQPPQQHHPGHNSQNNTSPVTVRKSSLLNDIFDDGLSPTDRKPSISTLQAAISRQSSSNSVDVKANDLEDIKPPKMPRGARNSPNVDTKSKTEKERKKKESKEKQPKPEKEPKKRKIEALKKEKEPKEKKTKASDIPINILPTLSLKNFKIPKKEANDDQQESLPPASSVSRRDPPMYPGGGPAFNNKDSDYHSFGAFPKPLKKKTSSVSLSSSTPSYSTSTSSSSSSRSRKTQPIPPPLPRSASSAYPSGRSGYSASYYNQQKTVASYAQGVPPGMGPPAAGPHSHSYSSGQWVRPPAHRDSHHHSSSSRDRAELKNDDNGPDSPEETLRIADE
ncbi:unnamed protein product [Caenorhabditis bovis]|uniref:Uncharacterized protein n=1 Tax=Caenorhabditis bovis TaxID=2654633 RepID=A0A8S1F518_9PELO|nr:unnamed protein product [Caenorhabditis bovis]